MGARMTCHSQKNVTGADWGNWGKTSPLPQCPSGGVYLTIYYPPAGANWGGSRRGNWTGAKL